MAQQLIVVVNKLNKRSTIPSDLSDKRSVVGVVGKGFQFEGMEVTGVPHAVPGKWFQDRNGFYYWGGGLTAILPGFDRIPEIKITSLLQVSPVSLVSQVSQVTQVTQITQIPQVAQVAPVAPVPSLPPLPDYDPADYFNLPFIPGKMSWAHDFLKIPQLWKENRNAGKDVVIALIDTGMDVLHQDLKEAFLPQSICIDAAGIVDDHTGLEQRLEDLSGHGTAMAGILAASGKSQVYGIAPQCRLLLVKVRDSLPGEPPDRLSGISPQVISNAFQWLSQQRQVSVDLISVGFALDREHDELKKNVQTCLDKGIAVFAPIGDDHLVARNDTDVYPACYQDCTAIGAFNSSGELCSFSNWNPRLSLIAPGDRDLLTAGRGNSRTRGGQTAIAAAIAAGSFALLLSCRKQLEGSAYSGRSVDYLQDLYLAADPLQKFIPGEEAASPAFSRDPMYGYGRLNLQNAIGSVKKKLFTRAE
ncbi:S8 family peptidase [Flavitalea flava]